MPAPAVIPALIAYVKVVAVKTLVVATRPSKACVRDWIAALITGHAQRLTRGDVGRMRLGLSRLRMGHRVLGWRALALWPSARLRVPFTMTKLACSKHVFRHVQDSIT